MINLKHLHQLALKTSIPVWKINGQKCLLNKMIEIREQSAPASHWGRRSVGDWKGNTLGSCFIWQEKGRKEKGCKLKTFKIYLDTLKMITKPTCSHLQSNNQQALWRTSLGKCNCLPLFPDRLGRSSSLHNLLILARLQIKFIKYLYKHQYN